MDKNLKGWKKLLNNNIMSVKNNLSPTKTYVDQQLLKYDISKSKSSKAHQVD